MQVGGDNLQYQFVDNVFIRLWPDLWYGAYASALSTRDVSGAELGFTSAVDWTISVSFMRNTVSSYAPKPMVYTGTITLEIDLCFDPTANNENNEHVASCSPSPVPSPVPSSSMPTSAMPSSRFPTSNDQ